MKSSKWKIGAAKSNVDIESVKSDIGTLSTLTTTDKTSLVKAINEVRTTLVVLNTNFNSLVALYAAHTHDYDNNGTPDTTDGPN